MRSRYFKIISLLCLAISFPLQAKLAIHDGLDALSHHEFAKAEKIFAEQADKGDVHARYWQANAMFLQRGEKAFAAGRIMLQAAKKGDPWAMNRLDPSNNESPCGMFGWPCDSKWLDKALATWKKQAEQGDGNAELALLLRDRPWYTKYIPILSEKLYANRAIDAFSHGSDYAAFKILHTNVTDKYKYIKEVAEKGNGAAEYNAAFSYKKYSSNFIKYMKRSVIHGFSKATFYMFTYYKVSDDYEKAYFYGLLGKYLGESGNRVDPFFEGWIKNLSKDKKLEIKRDVDKYIKENNIKPTKNYSEFSEEFFGIY
ncbi:hypothetical protein [Celerinatantimonas sp. MCCC 1A17872]|uniref:hypothetical protein n=1 Tax=Celerinatantimonas sp. MCCC 1A17872 TaxID=3177514 RepID=UPI0038C4177B